MSLRVTHLRHVDLAVREYTRQVDFYGGVWGLLRTEHESGMSFFSAEGSPEQFVLRVRKASEDRLDLIAFGVANSSEVDEFAYTLAREGIRFVSEPGRLQTPGGGYGFRFFDPDGRTVELSSDVEDRPFRVLEPREAIPEKLSHVVLDSANLQTTIDFYLDTLGLRLSGWLGDFFSFMRCDGAPDFHSVALVRSQNSNLHHVAFHSHGLDEYMRSVGRALRAGVPMLQGIGKHLSDPADAAFSYFIDPNGFVCEHHAPQTLIVDNETYTPPYWDPKAHPEVWGTARSQNLPEEELVIQRSHADPGLGIAPPV